MRPAPLEVVVLLDETRELHLDDVEEGVDLFLVVPTLADRRLLERDVVYFGRGKRHFQITSVLVRTGIGADRMQAADSNWTERLSILEERQAYDDTTQ